MLPLPACLLHRRPRSQRLQHHEDTGTCEGQDMGGRPGV